MSPMRKREEGKLQAKLLKSLRDIGARVLKLHGHAMQAAGWPDTYVTHPKFSGWVELKSLDRKTEPLQKKIMNELRRNYVPAFVVRPHHVIKDMVVVETPDGEILGQSGLGVGLLITLSSMWSDWGLAFAGGDEAKRN